NTGSVSVDAGSFGSLTTDALAFHCILDSAGRPASWMCDEGSSVIRDDAVLLSSSLPVRILCVILPDGLQLTVRSATTADLRLRVPTPVTRVCGPGLRDWSMEGEMLRLSLDGDADLEISFSGTATDVAGSDGHFPLVPQLHAPYPQPLQRTHARLVHVPYTLGTPAPLSFILYDALGRVVRSRNTSAQEAGTHIHSVAVGELPAGQYLLRLQSGSGSSARRIVIY
ncbi:MAG: T9SS type A sorting domain-containing protein, partial [Bacteroidota bacterium]|nr:T9SS type A sorting domain-containing protein [Bacteroidota bacterium]